jgi:CHAT domain-containing protein
VINLRTAHRRTSLRDDGSLLALAAGAAAVEAHAVGLGRLLLVLSFACSTVRPSVPVGESGLSGLEGSAPDWTFGICADVPSQDVRDADSLLAAAEEELRRGCPKQAFARLAQAERSGSLSARQRARRSLALSAAGVAARSVALYGAGIPWLPGQEYGEPWLTAHDPTGPWVAELREGLGSGSLPVAVREEGQIGLLLLHHVLPLACNGLEAALMSPSRMRGQQAALLEQYLVLDLLPTQGLGLLIVTAERELMACDLTSAARRFDEGAALALGLGRASQALELRLEAWATRFIPGGRAQELGYGTKLPEKFSNAQIAERAAARRGGGANRRRGAEALRALDEIQAVLPAAWTPALRAKAAWLRALVAYRLSFDLGQATRCAREAVRLAVEARRADLLDASRTLLVLVAAEQNDGPGFEGGLRAVLGSTAHRGAIGARHFFLAAVNTTAELLALEGRVDDAARLVERALARAGALGGVASTSMFRDFLVGQLIEAGRLEDAALVAAQTVVELRAIDDGTSPRARELFVRDFVIAQKVMEGTVEDVEPELPQPPGLKEFFERGETDGLRRPPDFVSLDPERANETFLALLQRELQRPADPRLAAIRRWRIDRLALAQNVSCRLRPRSDLAAAGRLVLSEIEFTTAHVDAMFSKVRDPMVLVARVGWLADVASIAADTLLRCGADLKDMALVELGTAVMSASVTGPAHFTPNEVEAYRREASGDLVSAASLLEEDARNALRDVSSSAGLGRFQGAGWLFAQAADLLLQSKPSRVADAVRVLESGRARDLRASRAAGAGAGAPSALLNVEREIARRNGHLRTLMISAAETPEESRPGVEQERHELTREIARLEEEHQRIAVGLARAEPSRYRAEALAPALDAGQIAARLGPDEAVAYYLVGHDRAWVIVIERTGAQAIPLAAVDGEGLPLLEARLRAYAHELTPVMEGQRGFRVVTPGGRRDEVLERLRRELHDLLIAPIERLVPPGRRLIIVPDEHLASIPWAELGPPDHPLFVRNPIRLLPGAFLIGPAADNARLSAAAPLVVGDPDSGPGPIPSQGGGGAPGQVWSPLPGSRQEADAVAGLLSAKPVIGSDADEAAVKARLPGATVVHFATHSRSEPRRPAFSVLVLARPRARSTEDGLLHAFEIETMHTGAQLVVLSACETGKGSVRGSEGVMALDRAFLVAGAGAVVSSLWQVDDHATAALMSAFYRSLSRGRPADVALAEAMGEVRAQPRWSDPRYWSAFRLVGWALR